MNIAVIFAGGVGSRMHSKDRPKQFLEMYNKPIITTDVSDSKKDIEGKYGIVCSKDVKQISKAMEEFINNGYEIKNKFDPEKYNNEIIKKIEDIILK